MASFGNLSLLLSLRLSPLFRLRNPYSSRNLIIDGLPPSLISPPLSSIRDVEHISQDPNLGIIDNPTRICATRVTFFLYPYLNRNLFGLNGQYIRKKPFRFSFSSETVKVGSRFYHFFRRPGSGSIGDSSYSKILWVVDTSGDIWIGAEIDSSCVHGAFATHVRDVRLGHPTLLNMPDNRGQSAYMGGELRLESYRLIVLDNDSGRYSLHKNPSDIGLDSLRIVANALKLVINRRVTIRIEDKFSRPTQIDYV